MKYQMLLKKWCFSLSIFLLLQNTLAAQKDSLTLFQSLYGEEIPHFHIKTNLWQIIRKKAKKENYKGVLTYEDADGNPQEWAIKIRARGNMRNKQCFLPPLKIDFKKRDLKTAGIKGKFDDLKLVVRCKGSNAFEDYVLKEYMTYKIYNILTEHSFRVQLIKLTLEDIEGRQKNMEAYAYVIESIEELAARVRAKIISHAFFKNQLLHSTSYDRMCVFQFMIGNADWHITKQHNTKIVGVKELNAAVAIPYDFDYSALVGTPYATPHTKLPIDDIRDRYYLGLCRETGAYDTTFDLYRTKKQEIIDYCHQFDLLKEKPKKAMLSYLNSFFEILDKPKAYQSKIVNHCDKHFKAY